MSATAVLCNRCKENAAFTFYKDKYYCHKCMQYITTKEGLEGFSQDRI